MDPPNRCAVQRGTEMLARLFLSLVIVLQAWPGFVCVASCRMRGSQRPAESCMMVCAAATPLVTGGACAVGQTSGKGCCAKRCQKDQADPPQRSPGKPVECHMCQWLFCSLIPAPKFLPAAESAQAPQPDSTPLLPWFHTSAHLEFAPNHAFVQAPPRPPWTPVRSMLSVWTI